MWRVTGVLAPMLLVCATGCFGDRVLQRGVFVSQVATAAQPERQFSLDLGALPPEWIEEATVEDRRGFGQVTRVRLARDCAVNVVLVPADDDESPATTMPAGGGAGAGSDEGAAIVVLTRPSQLAAAVGRRVRVEGVVSKSKLPQIAGVDVHMPSSPIPGSSARREHDLRGRRAWAEGVLLASVVRPEQVDNTVAHRGAGTFYQLVDPHTSERAVAHPLRPLLGPSEDGQTR